MNWIAKIREKSESIYFYAAGRCNLYILIFKIVRHFISI